jgi:Mn-containing catalase
VTDDPGVKDALAFLMTREAAHQLSFEKALQSIRNNFPPGKLPPIEEFTNKYYNMSEGGEVRGSWNSDKHFDYVESPSLRLTAAMAAQASRSQPNRQPWSRRCLPARSPIHIPTR